jgi:hypothetical protein
MTSSPHFLPPGSSPAETSGQRFSLNGALGVSLLAIILASLFVFSGVATVITTALAGGTGGAKSAQEIGKLTAKHQELTKSYQERFNGRSVFYKPPPPPKPQVAPPPRHEEPPPPPPGPAPPPTTYTGPTVSFKVGDTVYFKAATGSGKPFKLNLGETGSGVKVVSTSSPWTVRLAHSGREYDVPLFSGTDLAPMLPDTAKPGRLLSGIVPVIPGEPPLDLNGSPAATTLPAATNPDSASDQPAVPPSDAIPDGRARRGGRNPGRHAETKPATTAPAAEDEEQDGSEDEAEEGEDDAEEADEEGDNEDADEPPAAVPQDPTHEPGTAEPPATPAPGESNPRPVRRNPPPPPT